MNKLVVLLGPTGVGKTALSYTIADFLHSPVISADSRQLFRELRIGTAAPTTEQLAQCEHHFVGCLELDDYYSAAQYESEVLKLLESLFPTHPALLLTGGSMMYIDAVCQGIDDIPTVDADTRTLLLSRYESEGLESLVQELKLLDPEYYRIVDQKNPKRVLHALEICYLTGQTYTSFRTRTTRPRPFEVLKIGLTRPREELYARINARVDEMVAAGLIEEAKTMYDRYKGAGLPFPNSLNTVGYKELFAYFDGECSLSEALDKVRQHSRIYSRKQMTWFKRDPSIQWFHPDEEQNILLSISQFLSV